MLRKWLRLSADERRMVVATLRLIVALRWRLWLYRWPNVYRWAAHQNRKTAPAGTCAAGTIIRAVNAASRRVPGGSNCLLRGLAAYIILRRYGYPAELHIGVARDSDAAFAAHAWVDLHGRTVVGAASRAYTPLVELHLDPTVAA